MIQKAEMAPRGTAHLAMPRDPRPARRLTTFGAGLLLLALSGILVAITWQRHHPAGSLALAAWPLGVMVALVLPQFYLPACGRMVFSVVYAGAALLLAPVVASPRTTRQRSTVGG